MSEIIMYTTPTCGYCHMAKEYFRQQKVTYTEKDISSDADAYADILQKTGQVGVPVITVGEEFVIGFNPKELDRLISLARKEQ